MEYQWAYPDGSIVLGNYNSSVDSISEAQILVSLTRAFSQHNHQINVVKKLNYRELYEVSFSNDSDFQSLLLCVKASTPGGRGNNNLKNEQRIQFTPESVNAVANENGPLFGIYHRQGTDIIIAYKPRLSASTTTSSKQVKIETIAKAMKIGFSQQQMMGGSRDYVCAFREEFLYFYLQNKDWIHESPITALNLHSQPVPDYTRDRDDFLTGAINKIYYGAPGTGKSYKVSQEYPQYKRITFHPEYTYFDFVGGLKPQEVTEGSEKRIAYPFVPGPFAETLVSAFKNPEDNVGLIIEEINRANTAAVFGDIFQLLDRDSSGWSQYSITNPDLLNFIKAEVQDFQDEEITIPSNFSLIATMNSSDQGVYIMDAAFKRRWEFEYLPITFESSDFDDVCISGFNIPWKEFGLTLNNFLSSIIHEEDKLIGQRFISISDMQNIDKVASKLLIYLWDNVLRYKRDSVFIETTQFSKVVESFKENGTAIFVPELKNQLDSFIIQTPNDTANIPEPTSDNTTITEVPEEGVTDLG
ncbi:AAA family ATPase [Trichococcus sp.]|uniref:AAA family ATPase n=1 Tax=Trichococcus sp. TaxID=1985464 RepID=UPI003C7C2494